MEINFTEGERSRPGLNITPLIDVVFLLLIFFMLTSTFIEPRAIDLVLPGQRSAERTVSAEPVVVDITPAGVIRLNGLRLSMDQLDAEIAGRLRASPRNDVTVRAEAEVSVQLLVGVMDRIRAAGTRNIKLATPEAR